MISPRAVARLTCSAVLLALPAAASAQQQEPVGLFTADIRAIFARYKDQPSVANDLGVQPANLPGHGVGLLLGAHVYPLRKNIFSLGIGGHVLTSNASDTLETPSTGGTGGTGSTTTPTAPSPTVHRHFRAIAPEVSLNFGHRNGWSYISGGIGGSKLWVEREDDPVDSPPNRKMIHYGAGARWFTNHHLAVSLDFRWYSIAEHAASATGGVAQPHTTLLVLSGGIGLR
jgi:hypothetical protein